MLRSLGIPVLDADQVRTRMLAVAPGQLRTGAEALLVCALLARQCVHELYAAGGAAVAPVGAAFPGVVVDEAISREALGKYVVGPGKEDALKQLEQIVHPLVAAQRSRFLDSAASRGDPLVVLDVPLLYETGVDAVCDAVAVVSTCNEEVQRSRVLARPGMTPAKLDGILARQMPDAEKRRRAAFVIDTSCDEGRTRQTVLELIAQLAHRESART